MAKFLNSLPTQGGEIVLRLSKFDSNNVIFLIAEIKSIDRSTLNMELNTYDQQESFTIMSTIATERFTYASIIAFSYRKGFFKKDTLHTLQPPVGFNLSGALLHCGMREISSHIIYIAVKIEPTDTTVCLNTNGATTAFLHQPNADEMIDVVALGGGNYAHLSQNFKGDLRFLTQSPRPYAINRAYNSCNTSIQPIIRIDPTPGTSNAHPTKKMSTYPGNQIYNGVPTNSKIDRLAESLASEKRGFITGITSSLQPINTSRPSCSSNNSNTHTFHTLKPVSTDALQSAAVKGILRLSEIVQSAKKSKVTKNSLPPKPSTNGTSSKNVTARSQKSSASNRNVLKTALNTPSDTAPRNAKAGKRRAFRESKLASIWPAYSPQISDKDKRTAERIRNRIIADKVGRKHLFSGHNVERGFLGKRVVAILDHSLISTGPCLIVLLEDEDTYQKMIWSEVLQDDPYLVKEYLRLLSVHGRVRLDWLQRRFEVVNEILYNEIGDFQSLVAKVIKSEQDLESSRRGKQRFYHKKWKSRKTGEFW